MAGAELTVHGEAAMLDLGARLAALLPATAVVFLHGDLGAGKTTLVRGLIQSLDPGRRVKSPTFTLVEPYESLPIPVYHFDLYRLADPQELELIGARDYFAGGRVLVEWPDKAQGQLPAPDLEVFIDHRQDSRRLRFEAAAPALQQALVELCDQARRDGQKFA